MKSFSYESRQKSIRRFKSEEFDILVIGGGITGAAVARDAASRGFKVALVEKRDFAWGTSSRSSKLIHGGLRYLENYEFGLVFEALSERAHLLKTTPNLVKPLPFYMPIYKHDKHGRGILGMGFFLYDLLALFRTPGFHKYKSRKKLLKEIPNLSDQGLKGGFRYYDASMWDDLLTVDTLRSAHDLGAAIANYVDAISPLHSGTRVTGFKVRDLESSTREEITIHAHKTIVCAGPWTDELGHALSEDWKPWLSPSRGTHIVFDAQKFPMPGAMVMTNEDDGRVAFIIPRPDFGAGVCIVGTTDGPLTDKPEKIQVVNEDVDYLLDLLRKYFPKLGLTRDDIISAYVGVRPLMGDLETTDARGNVSLQKISREHHIGDGPGGTVMVAGGKYTTHRVMAEEIVDYAIDSWEKEVRAGKMSDMLPAVRKSNTQTPVNIDILTEAVSKAKRHAQSEGYKIPDILWDQYGTGALDVYRIFQQSGSVKGETAEFPMLSAQLRYMMRTRLVMHLDDFYFRRLPLFLSRRDHGVCWAKELSRVWAHEKGVSEQEADQELDRLLSEIQLRDSWRGDQNLAYKAS